MEFLATVVSVLGGSALLVGAAGWLSSKFVESRLNRDLETYKSKLKAETDLEIENLKFRLQMDAKEREITVSWLHQKRAMAIETLHTALLDLEEAASIVLDVLSPRNPVDIRAYSAAAVKKTRETYQAYYRAKIYMSPGTCEKIKLVLDSFQEPVFTYECFLGNYDDHELHTLADVKNHSWKEIRENVPGALRELESEFRKVLGVDLH